MMAENPVVKDIVLLGGGHAHVIVIRKWAMKPVPGVRLTLVSQDALTPYSGMLPGLIAGHYTVAQSNIDLSRLCQWAGVRFIEQQALGVDTEEQKLLFHQRPGIAYDYLSIDTGGTPRLDNVKGARKFTTPVKPVHQFHRHWQQVRQRAIASDRPLAIGVVGAGAGGFEVLMAMQYCLNTSDTDGKSMVHQFHWVIRDQALSDYPKRVQSIAVACCRQQGIQLHHDFDVVKVKSGSLISRQGEEIALDEVLWCTDAQAPSWPRESGLSCNKDGFITVNDSLQSTSHYNIFACGDVAMQLNHPRPRAGVFAVRQGPIVFENLQRVVVGQPLRQYRPQKKFLTLLSMGSQSAIASKGSISLQGKWVWKWKDWIDRRFMSRFNLLPPMSPIEPGSLSPVLASELDMTDQQLLMRCGGCGAKVASDVLSRVLGDLEVVDRSDLVIGLSTPDDVAIINTDGRLLAQSVDQIRSIVDDPWIFGRIAAIHALSDLYAVGATPQSAMVLAALPFSSEAITGRDLKQIMSGVAHELKIAGCALSGGHTSESSDLSLGFAVNGYPVSGVRIPKGGVEKDGAAVGGAVVEMAREQLFILTKPLGVGVVMAAHMRARADASLVQDAMAVMLKSNARASEIFLQHEVIAMTDVTGFGLIGHLSEMLDASDFSCRLNIDKIPVLAGAIELSKSGIRSSLYDANHRFAKLIHVSENIVSRDYYPLLFDPQTSGGLLAAVPASCAIECIEQLVASGYDEACVIGEVVASGSAPILMEN